MPKRRSYPTTLPFEFIDIQRIDDRISKCFVKILYPGKNRNKTFISKAVGNLIANSLPRTPIVGFYNETVRDFEDHGEELIINKNGLKVIKKTRPYGAISEWGTIGWKEYLDSDGVTREYLVAEGYLWTGRYPEVAEVIKSGKGQSLEFFEDSIQGNWATFDNEDEQFFIFNEAEVSALCILGDDVEPCFEGASINNYETEIDGIYQYSLNKDEFKKEFDEFIAQLNETNERSKHMKNVKTYNLDGATVEVIPVESFESTEAVANVETVEEVVETVDAVEAVADEATTEVVEEVVSAEETVEATVVVDEVVETEKVESTEFESVDTTGQNGENHIEENSSTVEEPNSGIVYTLEQYNEIKSELDELKAKYDLLVEKEKKIEDEAKFNLIDKFSLILGEDVMPVKLAARDYTIEKIDEILSIMAFRKGVSFAKESTDSVSVPKATQPVSSLPAWLEAVDQKQKQKQQR